MVGTLTMRDCRRKYDLETSFPFVGQPDSVWDFSLLLESFAHSLWVTHWFFIDVSTFLNEFFPLITTMCDLDVIIPTRQEVELN